MPSGAPSASGGSSLMKSCQPWVGMPKPTAVYALSWAIWMLSSGAPSMRLNAFRTPLSSTIAMSIGTSISAAFASAASIARRAASVLMLALGNVLAMGLLCRGGNRSARLPPPARAHARRVRAALGRPEATSWSICTATTRCT